MEHLISLFRVVFLVFAVVDADYFRPTSILRNNNQTNNVDGNIDESSMIIVANIQRQQQQLRESRIMQQQSTTATLPPINIAKTTCYAGLRLMERSKDGALSPDEYSMFIEWVTRKRYGGTKFSDLPQVLQDAFNSLAANTADNSSIDLSGVNPNDNPTPEQTQYLDKICNDSSTAIDTADNLQASSAGTTSTSTSQGTSTTTASSASSSSSSSFTRPASGCGPELLRSDIDKNNELDEKQYIRFVIFLTRNAKFSVSSLDQLPEPLRTNFNELVTASSGNGTSIILDAVGSSASARATTATNTPISVEELCNKTSDAITMALNDAANTAPATTTTTTTGSSTAAGAQSSSAAAVTTGQQQQQGIPWKDLFRSDTCAPNFANQTASAMVVNALPGANFSCHKSCKKYKLDAHCTANCEVCDKAGQTCALLRNQMEFDVQGSGTETVCATYTKIMSGAELCYKTSVHNETCEVMYNGTICNSCSKKLYRVPSSNGSSSASSSATTIPKYLPNADCTNVQPGATTSSWTSKNRLNGVLSILPVLVNVHDEATFGSCNATVTSNNGATSEIVSSSSSANQNTLGWSWDNTSIAMFELSSLSSLQTAADLSCQSAFGQNIMSTTPEANFQCTGSCNNGVSDITCKAENEICDPDCKSCAHLEGQLQIDETEQLMSSNVCAKYSGMGKDGESFSGGNLCFKLTDFLDCEITYNGQACNSCSSAPCYGTKADGTSSVVYHYAADCTNIRSGANIDGCGKEGAVDVFQLLPVLLDAFRIETRTVQVSSSTSCAAKVAEDAKNNNNSNVQSQASNNNSNNGNSTGNSDSEGNNRTEKEEDSSNKRRREKLVPGILEWGLFGLLVIMSLLYFCSRGSPFEFVRDLREIKETTGVKIRKRNIQELEGESIRRIDEKLPTVIA